MKTAVIGYPRMGENRELKFLIEDYFKNNVTRQALEDQAAVMRHQQLKQMAAAGIAYIPLGDFSYYDNMLDTACLFNIIPQRYRALGLDALDTYFAMARGYQADKGDVKALPMKKWFNTNYHYIVPTFEEDIDIRLAGSALFDQYSQAAAQGVDAVPTLIGPFTLLKLAQYPAKKKAEDYIDALIEVYGQVFDRLASLGARWIALQEPSLVQDVTEEETVWFSAMYRRILAKKSGLNVVLQTYFGDIRDVYPQVVSLPFDAVGLDFVEGTQSLELVKRYGFPKDKRLVAGVVNGKNIWRNRYAHTLDLLKAIGTHVEDEQLIIGSSCSLLHVPYTVKNETLLPAEVTAHFAFAREKLDELRQLGTLYGDDAYKQSPAFLHNEALFAARGRMENRQVRQHVAALTESDFTRRPDFAQRKERQRQALKLPLLPTTTIGSFPQTADVKANRARLRRGDISPQQYQDGVKAKIAECIALQEDIGLDVLVHGEFERNDMVEHFGEHLSGFLFTKQAWVQSYGTRCVKPPIIWGDVSRQEPITVETSVYTQSLTKKPVKGMLTGPVTILNWSFPREDISHRDMAFQIALAIRGEVLDLEASGLRIIQIDEAALKEKLPLRKQDWHTEYLNWAIPAFRLVHAGVKPETQIHTHMCYSEFSDIIRDIDNMDADVISFEASRSGLALLDVLKQSGFKTQVGPGVYDIHSPRVPGEQEIVAVLQAMLQSISAQNLWVNPDCGLKTRGEAETILSLHHLVQAAKCVRQSLPAR